MPCKLTTLLNTLANPTEKLDTLLWLLPILDDAAVPRGRLMTLMYIIADYYEEITEALELYAREADGADDERGERDA